ncbi:MAG TPA: hypothetical protein VFZ21_24675 [Gemmatimonadaceae bacterium]|nr:hypothetical protein [Gemmatimonadaceae bacterium]
MKKLISVLLVLAAACSQRQVTTGSPPRASGNSASGAASAQGAVQSYMTAVKTQDLQAMSAVWGSKDGSVLETRVIPRDEVERRELIILCFLKHDSYRILGDAPGADGRRVFATEISRGGLTRSTNFTVVPGPAGRWFVENVELEPLRDLVRRDPCAPK